MTSGNIQMGPDPDQVRDALDAALREDPALREKLAANGRKFVEQPAEDGGRLGALALLHQQFLEAVVDPRAVGSEAEGRFVAAHSVRRGRDIVALAVEHHKEQLARHVIIFYH